MSADGSRSTRAAAKLVAQADRAFALGDEDIGRQLLSEAATMYEHAGDEGRAAELRGAMASPSRAQPISGESPPLLPGAPTGRRVEAAVEPPRLVPPLEDDDSSEAAPDETPSGAPPTIEDTPITGEQLVADLAEVFAGGEADAIERPPGPDPTRRLAEARRARLGRSPTEADVAALLEEHAAALACGASAYANHVARTIELVAPGQSPPLERPVDLAIEAPVEAEPGAWAARVDAALDPTPLPRVETTTGAIAEIDAAITALVQSGDASDISFEDVPLDFGGPTRVAPSVPAPKDLTGAVLRGRFALERRIGRGAQAQVYLARDQVLARPVAIKILSEHLADDPEALEGFLSEARLAAGVHHAGCLSVFDFGSEGSLPFLAMEHFEGRSLRALLRGGALEPRLALHLARRLAEALSAVHEAGIVHRDVKPSNVLVDRAARVKLSDFGVAVRLDDPHEEGVMVGTLRYMAPEQARGRAPDPRSDIFALGAVVWEMLVGEPAFEPTIEATKARISAPPPRLPAELALPERAREVIERCLAPDPAARPPSAARLAQAFRKLQSKLRARRRSESAGPEA